MAWLTSETAGIGAQVDRNDVLADGGYMGWEYGPADRVVTS